MSLKKGYIRNSSLLLLLYFCLQNSLCAAKTLKYRTNDQLEASCTKMLLHLSFLLEYDMLKIQSREFPEQVNHAQVRARISQEVFNQNNFFTNYIQSQPIIPSIAGTQVKKKLNETFNSIKHKRLWEDLEEKTQGSAMKCNIHEGKMAWKVSKALFNKNYRFALKLLFTQTRQAPSTRLLYEWIQRLYARSQRSPGKVSLEHLK